AYLDRDLQVIGGKPRFTGFQPADDRTSDLISEKGPIAPGKPLLFVMDELALRRQDNWPGEIGHFNISGSMILVSQAVRDRISALKPDGLSLTPAVLEDMNGNFIEPLFHLKFNVRRDVWDRERSEYLIPFDPDRDRSANLVRIFLDDDAMADLSPDARPLLKLDKVSPPAILFRTDLVQSLQADGVTTGAVFYPLAEWFDGIQFQ
ncbi:MAG: hypothetical protein AAFU56_08325, partial [Pseudomonadota bacterium]